MICILSDYGTESIYVAELIGVIKSINPQAEVFTLVNNISRQNVFEAAFILDNVAKEYPAGSIFLCIVDPTVGTKRLPLVFVCKKHLFIGPDNGSLYLAASKEGIIGVYEIDVNSLPKRKISKTFHGRDIFAVAAAILSLGFKPDLIGRKVNDFMKIHYKPALLNGNKIEGEVIFIDSFGNAVTNIGEEFIANLKGRQLRLVIPSKGVDVFLPFVSTYAEVEEQKPLLLIDSFDLLEIAVNKGSAKDLFSIKEGEKIIIEKP